MIVVSVNVAAILSLVVVVVAIVAADQKTTTKTSSREEDLIYGFECQMGKCMKIELNEENFDKAISLPVCQMLCGTDLGTVWPKPTGEVKVEPLMLHIDGARITYNVPTSGNERVNKLWSDVEQRFNDQLQAKIPNPQVLKSGGHALNVDVTLTAGKAAGDLVPQLELDTSEAYELHIMPGDGDKVNVNVTAENFFGARHALETLAQLIVYDDIRRELQLLGKVDMSDAPTYKWRGLLLDTARSYYSVKAIKRTLDAMAMVKLNTFHWHITDSHSFPLEVKSEPQLSKLGAYGPRKVYTHDVVRSIVEYGRARGIRVIPEFDAPAHVGEGWQHSNMTACFRAQPWSQYCVEPPCGQLDPTVDALYDVLGHIYGEMYELFQPIAFHMGGDEVSVACWNSSANIQNWMLGKKWALQEADFMRLWNEFQTRALHKLDKVTERQLPIILWTSRLTQVPYIDDFLNKSRYIIQVWTSGGDLQVQQILKRGYRTIMSNYDALYFDCGNAAWVDAGNNWCSPYIGWQLVYDNNVRRMAGDYDSLILGSEAAIWSEQIDEQTLDSRVWPRASAMAERLWSQPMGTWREAESRMLLHRERLVENNIGAELLQPEWCLLNEGECPINAYIQASAAAN